MTAIVTVNVSQTIAPTPNKLQKTGAFLSQGGTVTTPGTQTLLTQASDLDAVLSQPAAITSLTFSANVVTAACTAAHGLTVGNTIFLTIADSVGTTTAGGYNGTFPCTITSTTAFTYPLAGSTPGGTPSGTWVSAFAPSLQEMTDTFFGQGSQQGVYVLELGSGNTAQGVAFLDAWIAANPGIFYSYLVPRFWDANVDFLAFLAGFEATTSKTYFFVTTTLQTYANYTALMKNVFAMIETPRYAVWPQDALTNLSFSGTWADNVLTAASWAATNGGTVTATTTTAHGVHAGNTITISGMTPAGYNGTFVALPGTTASTIKYALAVDPGSETVLGQLDNSLFGTATGTTTTDHGVSPGMQFTVVGALGATIANGYNGTFIALPGTTASTLTYALPADPGSSTLDGRLVASYYASAGVAAGEFSAAAPFFVTLNYNPSTTNKVTPTAFSYLFGVTPYPTQGNRAVLTTLESAAVNVVSTGAEGGISNSLLAYGTTKDERDFSYWYSVDWVQVNMQLAIANAVINGSNNPLNPLYYNQDGINRLQQVAASVLNNGITFGLVLSPVKQTQLDGPAFQTALDAGDFDGYTVINAVPFVQYSQENPSDYAIGQYNGLSAVYVPTRGFRHIVFNVNVTDFVTQ